MKGLVKGHSTIKDKQNEQNPQLSLYLEWVSNQLKGLERDICPPSDPRPFPGVKATRAGVGVPAESPPAGPHSFQGSRPRTARLLSASALQSQAFSQPQSWWPQIEVSRKTDLPWVVMLHTQCHEWTEKNVPQ